MKRLFPAACFLFLVAAAWLVLVDATFAQELMPIGQIQGRGASSGFLDRPVRFRAIVTGILEDENARGARFYTVYVQDVPGSEDGDPSTSDGLAIFAGPRRPAIAVGDIATFGGTVTEFYGLTEVDDSGLTYWIESRNNPLPNPVVIDPPPGNTEAAAYLERFEGMLVSLPAAVVAGPAHVGCGFSVVGNEQESRVVVSKAEDPAGQLLGVLHPSDVECSDMPAVATGDEIAGLIGPLTYHFDRFKIVYQDPEQLSVAPAVRPALDSPPATQDGQLMVATFNVNNHFDSVDDTGLDAEPKPSAAEVALKQAKIAATMGQLLNCPDILALQEVENEALLADLAMELAGYCGSLYQVNHIEGPDLRGADLALLTNPGKLEVVDIQARQGCSNLETGIQDPSATCPPGQQPLFSRPPLQVALRFEEQSLVVLVNHFKSKREGAEETAARRLAQAEHLLALTRQLQEPENPAHIIVTGDFNDYDNSAVMQVLQGQAELLHVLNGVPLETRYSYIFDGASQLFDWILISPSLSGRVAAAGILHSNADLPFQDEWNADQDRLAFRSSDHDVPYAIIDLRPAEMLVTPSPPPSGATVVSATAITSQPASDNHSMGDAPASAATVESGALADGRSQTSTVDRDPHPPEATQQPAASAGRSPPPAAPGQALALPPGIILAGAGFLVLATGALIAVVVIKRRRI